MKLKNIFLFLIFIIFIMTTTSCEPRIIDLNDDPMPNELVNTTWVKSEYTMHYGDLCLRRDYRIFQKSTIEGEPDMFISKTEYNFNNPLYEDVTIIKNSIATFNVDTGESPKRMKAVIQNILMNGVDVTGMEEVHIGAPDYVRDFQKAGDPIYYVYSTDYSDSNLQSLILASNDTLYPNYIAVNQMCYTKIYDNTITTVPDNFYPATWKIATFRDRVKDTVLDEPFVEIKQRKFSDILLLTGILSVKITYFFTTFPTETYIYTFGVTFDIALLRGSAILQSVTKNGVDVTGSQDNTLGDKPMPISNLGDTITLIVEHNGDVIKYTDADGEIPAVTFDGTVYTLSDDF